MALSIGNKNYRNLQEQVGFNTEQIEKILQFLDGLNIHDNVVVISDLATPLTTEELEIVNREVAFLIYSGELYIKKNVSSGIAYFDIVISISGTTTISFSTKEIAVTLSNGALGLTTNTRSTYSVTQIDTLLSAKSDTTYVDTQLALKANLSGANFTGSITAPSIIENMSGYEFFEGTPIGLTLETIFASVVKTGNKITFVWAGNMTRTANIGGQRNICVFGVPADILNKLYPTTVGGMDILDIRDANGVDDVNNAFVKLNAYMTKGVRLDLYMTYASLNNLTLNTKYYVRYECTFLLSDPLN